MIKKLSGSWHLRYSNFPMWQKKGTSNVSFSYQPTTIGGKPAMIDEISYFRNGKRGTVSGYDFPEGDTDQAFKWRGKGLIFFVTSHWRVEWMNDTANCMIISFAKTLVSPAGVDILAKEDATDSMIAHALKVLDEKSFVKDEMGPLLPVPR